MISEPVCNYAYLLEDDGNLACWGVVSVMTFNDMATGDLVAVPACAGHRGMINRGFYLAEGAIGHPQVDES